jgi:uncharacterized protein
VIVAVARLALHIPHSHSLKEKRAVVRRVVDRTQARFKVHVAEVEGQDTWQRAVLGFAVVSGDAGHAESLVDEVVRSIEGAVVGQGELIAVNRETLRFPEGAGFGQGPGLGGKYGE